MRTRRVLTSVLGCGALGLAFLAYQESRLVGFPDGFASDYDRVRRVLLILFAGSSSVFGVWVALLGWFAARTRIGWRWRLTLAAYAAVASLAFLADHCLRGLSGRGR